ncbi:hypothetical protein QFZ60_003846 [Arthrobacter sp. B2I5]|uniref:hypothetical protein n=1 Tax=Arthrobacter sp. B2I5 TaxID=3042266 RepID=UPI002789D50C|nr:hypothetical protein [Arthrobacter sp. B2I5]MDQ0827673.1 hypothetical protein [Arthrobacter sp. B2I5]
MMHGATFTGNLFFDPLATNLATNVPTNAPAGLGAPTQAPASALPSGPARKRGVQTAAEHRALRAASLSKVSRDLDRMLRDLKR